MLLYSINKTKWDAENRLYLKNLFGLDLSISVCKLVISMQIVGYNCHLECAHIIIPSWFPWIVCCELISYCCLKDDIFYHVVAGTLVIFYVITWLSLLLWHNMPDTMCNLILCMPHTDRWTDTITTSEHKLPLWSCERKDNLSATGISLRWLSIDPF